MKCHSVAVQGFAIAIAILCGVSIATVLPIVDLGYAVHQATLNVSVLPPTSLLFLTSSKSSEFPYYNFSNIRYGQPPVGHLRFAPPLAPHDHNRTINDGQIGVIPAQANPAWQAIALPFLLSYLNGKNYSQFSNETSDLSMVANLTIPAPNPHTSEDCLFLDVIVPQKIFASSENTAGMESTKCTTGEPCNQVAPGAPVLVWIFGGGYTSGSKTSAGNPATLIASSQLNGSEGVIFVAMNYRLGLFGWLSGNDNVTPNVGLLDQRLALEWVQQHIHLFGGDASRVTVIGESAGAGSIMHHITSYGGTGASPPFQQAIPQSPAFQVFVPEQSKSLFSQVLNITSLVANKSITSAKDLRALPFEVLATVNALMVGSSAYGSFTFGPVIDPSPQSYVPDLPLRLLAQDNVSVMVGHNSNEALVFTPPFIATSTQYDAAVAQLFPSANASTISYISQTLYPPVYSGVHGYVDIIGRLSSFISDFLIGCNAHYLAQNLLPGFAYLFTYPPGLHGEDVSYTFFNGDTSTLDDGSPVDDKVAAALQRYLTTYAMAGTPMAESLPTFSAYGQNDTISCIGAFGLGSKTNDPTAKPVCQFWAAAPYYITGSS
ncbi:hypothetical protein EG329_006354 [Mollisiaceae sp. DMI_Dod_QoI]|nr:hypothetical protein EG329_006354 [Helotiales sp. DMI_Dod_QoI]